MRTSCAYGLRFGLSRWRSIRPHLLLVRPHTNRALANVNLCTPLYRRRSPDISSSDGDKRLTKNYILLYK